VTLLIHRIRAARAAQRDRAPEDIVHNLPWQIWTGNGWEKHDNAEHDSPVSASSVEMDLEQGVVANAPVDNDGPKLSTIEDASTSFHNKLKNQPWFESQLECAICLSEFVKGDKVRVLPCHHIFHLDEVDEWLIQRKKLVRYVNILKIVSTTDFFSPVSYMQGRRHTTPRSIRHTPNRTTPSDFTSTNLTTSSTNLT
jgi:hypothetical protein